MAVGDLDELWTNFIRGRLAFWSGDFDAAERYFGHVISASSSLQTPVPQQEARIVRVVANAYADAMRHERPVWSIEIGKTPRPCEIETKNLKGIVWRKGIAVFEMRGYLSNLQYEPRLRDRFSQLCRRRIMTDESQSSNAERQMGEFWIARNTPWVVVVTAQ
jgi:hypothetical protein